MNMWCDSHYIQKMYQKMHCYLFYFYTISCVICCFIRRDIYAFDLVIFIQFGLVVINNDFIIAFSIAVSNLPIIRPIIGTIDDIKCMINSNSWSSIDNNCLKLKIPLKACFLSNIPLKAFSSRIVFFIVFVIIDHRFHST